MDKLPVIPEDLLQALDKLFPERCPEPEWSDREIWLRTGERKVIRFLKRVYEQQSQNVLRETYVFRQDQDS